MAEIPVPYRVGLYRRLREPGTRRTARAAGSAGGGIDLKLLFCAATQADRDWVVSLDGVPHVVLRGATLGVRPREQFFLRINPQVWRELSRFEPDLVVVGGYAHVTMQLAMLWCRWTRTPYMINSESHHKGRRQLTVDSSQCRKRPSLTFLSTVNCQLSTPFKRFFIRGAAACLPAGSLAREYLIEHGGKAERMFRLPNTCDAERFARESGRARIRREALRAELGLGPDPVVLYVGRLTPVKGLDTLLRAFQQVIPGTGCPRSGRTVGDTLPQLLLVGEGEQRRELEALAGTLGVRERVRFAGSRPWAELPALYAAADLLVLPSTFEPWGAVVNEALACGLPVIASDQVGCAPDLVRPGENGWIVTAGNPETLAAALREALSDPARLTAMGAASARLAPLWSEDACLESFTAAVKSVVDG